MPNAPFLAPGRDPAFKAGRAKMSGTTFNCVPGVVLNTVGTGQLVTNQDYYQPFFVSSPIIVDQLLAEVTTLVAGGNFRMGVYPADVDWQPAAGAAPLADSGDISSASTGVKTYTPSTPLLLPRGRYLSVMASSNGTAAFRLMKGGSPGNSLSSTLGGSVFLQEMVNSRTYAAFPTPGTAWTVGNTSSTAVAYFFVYRISQP
jgi:hypothetical protein